jgi:outer membrane lipoprotein-sorting protein
MNSVTNSTLLRFICSAVFVITAMAAHGAETVHPDPEAWLVKAEAAYGRVDSYTAIFHKQQRFAGKLLEEENIFLKFRKKPYSLYMKWVTEPFKGSELLYVSGWNEDRIKAHRGGFFSFVVRNLEVDDPLVMQDNLRPVTSTGVGFLLKTVAINMRKAIKAGVLTFTDRGKEKVYGRDTEVMVIDIPHKYAKAYDGAQLVINQDVENRILLRIRVYDSEGRLTENYGYENLKLDARLTDADFDPKNLDYDF